MEIPSKSESLCLGKFQREALLCLNTFPAKVTELNNLIDLYTPETMKKCEENIIQRINVASSYSMSIKSTTSDNYFHDVGSRYSERTHCRDRDRCKSRNGICKRKYRLYPTRPRRSRPLAHILALLVNRLAVCTRAMFIKPSMYIIDSVTAMFLKKEQLKHVQCGTTSNIWNSMNLKDNSNVVNNLISTMRPAAVRLIADTTILKRWLQAIAIASDPPSQSLSQAIRTTETIDGWAYEFFFHLKYLQVINFPCESVKENVQKLFGNELHENDVDNARSCLTLLPDNGVSVTDDVMHANLWHRIVQLRDHYVILFETLQKNAQFLKSDVPMFD